MENMTDLQFDARVLFQELRAAEQLIKIYAKTSEHYKYYKDIIKNTKTKIKELSERMTGEEHYYLGKWLVNRGLTITRNIIKGCATTNSQRIKQLHKYFELSEIARVDSYRNYFFKTILDY